MSDYSTGRIDCPQNCEIPDGVQLKEMPPTRHAWSDIIHCPHDDCGRFFMVTDCREREAKR